MKKDESLKKIIADLKENTFEISVHGYQRMSERSISVEQILSLINSPAIDNYWWSNKHESWNFTGKGLARDEFTIACVYEEETLIVTVFWD